jgi:hypothetical protein
MHPNAVIVVLIRLRELKSKTLSENIRASLHHRTALCALLLARIQIPRPLSAPERRVIGPLNVSWRMTSILSTRLKVKARLTMPIANSGLLQQHVEAEINVGV